MRTVHRKTTKGVHEIATRSRRLSQRLRAALIMINGTTSDEELLPLLGPDGQKILDLLKEQGYIEFMPDASSKG